MDNEKVEQIKKIVDEQLPEVPPWWGILLGFILFPFVVYGLFYIIIAAVLLVGDLGIPNPAFLASCHVTGEPFWCDRV